PATTTGEPPACITLGGFGAYAAGSLIENNICDFHRATQSGYGGGIVFNGADVTAVAIKNNLYSTNINYWRYAWDYSSTTLADIQARGEELGSIQADPLLTAPGAGGACGVSVLTTGPQPCPSAYQLQHGSPALGAGIAVSNDGGRDYYGNPTTPHNIGADQGAH